MKKLLIAAVLAWPFAAAEAQAPSPSPALLESLPGLSDEQKEEPETAQVQKPDAQKIMSELFVLRLSSKQEQRIASAIDKKAKEFDKLARDYDRTSGEEKKWRYKMNEQRYQLLKITQGMPDLVRDYLDEEQRQTYDAMLDTKNKPAAGDEAAVTRPSAPASEAAVSKPVKKRRVLRKKRPALPPAVGAALPAAEAAAVPAEDEPGQVMVDGEQPARKPAARKKKVLRKKAAAPISSSPAGDVATDEPAGSGSSDKEAPAPEEDAGSYP